MIINLIKFLVSSANQKVKNYFYSKRWFQNEYRSDYFLKVNGNWEKIPSSKIKDRVFNKGENVQKAYISTGFVFTFCQNQECRSIIQFTGEPLGTSESATGSKIVGIKCICCGKKQYFIPYGRGMSWCDKDGNSITSKTTIKA